MTFGSTVAIIIINVLGAVGGVLLKFFRSGYL